MVSADDAARDDAADAEVTEDEDGPWLEPHRVGERPLNVLAVPLNVMILRALEAGPLRLAALRRATGLPPQTTLRGHVAKLVEIGAIAKQSSPESLSAVEHLLTPMGWDMLGLAAMLEDWLESAPSGPIALTSGAATGVIRALVDGWSATILQAVASRPMSLTELDHSIEGLSYSAVERRLASLRMAQLIEALPSVGSSIPYTLSEWGRRGVAPLVAAGRCETVHMRGDSATVTQRDVEAAFMMAMPLIGLPAEASGSCRLEVESDGNGPFEAAEVTVTVDAGAVIVRDPDPDAEPVAHVVGSAESWFVAVGEDAPEKLRLAGGEGELAGTIVSGLHTALVPG